MLKNYKKVDLNTVYKMEKVCLKVVVDCLYGHCVDCNGGGLHINFWKILIEPLAIILTFVNKGLHTVSLCSYWLCG